MKKILLIFAVLFSMSLYGNETKETIEKVGNELTKSVNDVGDNIKAVTDSVSPLIENGAETFEQAITPYVKKVLSGVEDGVDFAMGEIPIIIKQYLLYETVIYGMLILMSILLMFSIPIIKRKVLYSEEERDIRLDAGEYSSISYIKQSNGKYFRVDRGIGDITIEQAFTYILGGVLTLIGCIIFVINIGAFIKVTFMPKLYLVEKFIMLVS